MIESIQILKDALRPLSTVRAANGVIIDHEKRKKESRRYSVNISQTWVFTPASRNTLDVENGSRLKALIIIPYLT
ncbi:MAG: hypothetical protein ACLU4N_00300 [Butyricimonas faecihominis]